LEWPARIEGGLSTDFPAVTSDYFPTILDVLGYQIPAALKRPYDGVSLLPVMEGRLAQRPQPIGFQTRSMSTLTDNRYKLVHRRQGGGSGKSRKKPNSERWELYDLLSDPSETNDLAAAQADIVQKMQRQLRQWQASCAASSNGADY
jgi:arylsulfatase A-like enzyme